MAGGYRGRLRFPAGEGRRMAESTPVGRPRKEPMSHRPGEEPIAGRYRLTRFIAQGGMGEVWEALDLTLRQRVALKMVRRDLARRPTALARFKREISLARRVTHPNVCRIFDIGEHRDPATGETV